MWKLYNFSVFFMQKQYNYHFYIKHVINDYLPSPTKFETFNYF
jgi:hypothetical protein